MLIIKFFICFLSLVLSMIYVTYRICSIANLIALKQEEDKGTAKLMFFLMILACGGWAFLITF